MNSYGPFTHKLSYEDMFSFLLNFIFLNFKQETYLNKTADWKRKLSGIILFKSNLQITVLHVTAMHKKVTKLSLIL